MAEVKKGDRVAYTVKYHAGGTGPEASRVLTRTEYGTVTSLSKTFGFGVRRKVRIRVENPQEGRAKYVERYADDVTVVSGDLDEHGQPKLTYEYLASLAVMPRPDHSDVYSYDVHGMDGAYRNSPLDPAVGLHIHAPADNWNETQPEHPVHVCVNGKIAEVYPFGVINRLRQAYGEEWIAYAGNDQVQWMNRLLAANPEITRDDVQRRRDGL